MLSSRGTSPPRDRTRISSVSCNGTWVLYHYCHLKSESEVTQSCLTLHNPMDCSLRGSSVHGFFPGKSTGVGCHFLLLGIFPTQGLKPGLPHCRQTFYRLSHLGSPKRGVCIYIYMVQGQDLGALLI